MLSGANPTLQLRPSFWSSSIRKRSAAGFRLILELHLPLGLPRCEASIRRAPLRRAYSMVGSVSRILVSSVTLPSSESGTLKSTRMKTRCPSRCRSCMESFAMRSQPFLHQKLDEVPHAAGVTPLIVIPGDHLHTIASYHPGQRGIDDGGTVVAAIVHRNELLGFVSQNAFHRSIRGGLQGLVNFVNTGAFLHEGDQIHHRDVGSRDSHCKTIQLALEIRDDKMQRLGRSGRGRDH